MHTSPVTLVVDGNSLAYRAFHAYSRAALVDSHGRPQEVCYGFTRLLAAVCDKVRDHHGRLDAVVVGFDSPTNFRRQRDPGYKSSRPTTDPSLTGQLERLARLLASMGVHHVTVEGWEADDVCASAVREAREVGWRCVVATSDRDALALVGPRCEVLQIRNGMDSARFLDEAAVEEHYGVAPSRYPLMAALRGDPSDDLPGVPGLGPKKAAAVAAAYPGLDQMVADPDGVRALVGPAAAGRLVDHRAAVVRNLDLMALCDTLEVGAPAARLPSLERVVSALGTAQLASLQQSCGPRISSGPARSASSPDAPGDEPFVPVRRMV